MQQRADGAPAIALSGMNFGLYPGVNRKSRIESRFYGNGEWIAGAQRAIGRALPAAEALELRLITAAPDELDWGARLG